MGSSLATPVSAAAIGAATAGAATATAREQPAPAPRELFDKWFRSRGDSGSASHRRSGGGGSPSRRGARQVDGLRRLFGLVAHARRKLCERRRRSVAGGFRAAPAGCAACLRIKDASLASAEPGDCGATASALTPAISGRQLRRRSPPLVLTLLCRSFPEQTHGRELLAKRSEQRTTLRRQRRLLQGLLRLRRNGLGVGRSQIRFLPARAELGPNRFGDPRPDRL